MIYTLLIGHFVADFLCQSDWMAVNKSKRWDALAMHVGVYASVLGVFVTAMWLPGDGLMPVSVGYFLAVNAVAHFVQDAITSRITSRLWFFQREDGIWGQAPFCRPRHDRTIVNPWTPIDGKRHWFFVVIGFDQLLHYVTLFVTADWWLR